MHKRICRRGRRGAQREEDWNLSSLCSSAVPIFVVLTCLCLGQFSSTAIAAAPPVAAVAFAPDGQSVVVGSQAGVAVHSWPELKRLRSLETTVENVHDLAFSPDGKSLAVAGGTPAEEGRVEVVAWPSGKSLAVRQGHTDTVLAVAWKDNASFATASLDHEIALWNLEAPEPLRRYKGHSRGVSSLCFLEGGKLLVSGSLDQNLRVWNVASSEVVRTLNNHTKEVHGLALRPATEGLPMIASVAGDRTVRLWQPTIGRMVRFAKLEAIPLAVAWLPDGSKVAAATTEGHVLLIDPNTVEILKDVAAVDGWGYSLAVHPEDGTLLVGGRDGELQWVDTKTPKASP
jgi:WD40 repeat protein